MKKCPYCDQEIQNDVVVCKFCNKNINISSDRSSASFLDGLFWFCMVVALGLPHTSFAKVIPNLELVFLLIAVLILLTTFYLRRDKQEESFISWFIKKIFPVHSIYFRIFLYLFLILSVLWLILKVIMGNII